MHTIFISYSHQDEKWIDRIKPHLLVLERQGGLKIWYDRQLRGGDHWKEKIEAAIKEASMAILLISADFLSSDFILENEIPLILEREKRKEITIIPILVEPCSWKHVAWISEIQLIPKNGRALSQMKDQVDAILADFVEDLQPITPPPSPNISGIEVQFIAPSHDGMQTVRFSGDPKSFQPQTQILVKNERVDLSEIVIAMSCLSATVRNIPLDDGSLFEIGSTLYDQLTAGMDPEMKKKIEGINDVLVRIITANEFILRLPWHLMAGQGIVFSMKGWSTVVSHTLSTSDQELPPSPKILIIAPEPEGAIKTYAKAHLERIEKLFLAKDHRLAFGHHTHVVATWDEFKQKLSELSPEIVYFYGHGSENKKMPGLLFARGKRNKKHEVSIEDIAAILKASNARLKLFYVNWLSATDTQFHPGYQLEQLIPAVIINRANQNMEVARAQAMAFLDNIIFQGMPPHGSIPKLYGQIKISDLQTAQLRAATPYLHACYKDWKAHPPEQADSEFHDPYWHLKIDRITQFSIVAAQTRNMIYERKPRTLAFLWYGKQGQGVELFHSRLNVELRNHLDNTFLYEVSPDWPLEFTNFRRSCERMICKAFKARDLSEIGAKVRAQTHGAMGRQILVYIRHQPVSSSHVVKPIILKQYLKWWDAAVVPQFEKNQFVLLGVSFIVNQPEKFQRIVQEKHRIEDLNLSGTVFRLLNEMEELKKRDLRDFIKTHTTTLSSLKDEERDAIIERILEQTNGHYEDTVAEIRKMVYRVWDIRDEELKKLEAGEDEDEEY